MATVSSVRHHRPRGPLYLDASALAKLYLPESESAELNRRLQGRRDLLVSDLAVTEVVSSLSRRRREGAIQGGAVGKLHQALLTHLEHGFYRRVELLAGTHRAAERLLLSATAVPLRSADALHLALAQSADAGTVLTYDLRLAEAARAFGMAVHP